MQEITKRTDWLQTYTGEAFFPLEPDIEKIKIEDIAHALAYQCRYAGHSRYHYSVAQHSIYISAVLPKKLALAGLLHDAAETYLTDIPRPLKPFLPDYKKWERNLEELICQKYRVDIFDPAIKEMDTRILYNERDAFMGPPPRDWALSGGAIPDLVIEQWTPDRAEFTFLQRFYELATPLSGWRGQGY